MGGLGVPELLIILVLVLLLFGASRLPKLGRSLGEATKELKKAVRHDGPPAPADEARDEEQ